MPLFDIPDDTNKNINKTNSTSKVKLKRGQSIYDLIEQAEKLVEEKLSKYKDTSKCITDINVLKQFFNNTPDDGIIGIDTETTGLNTFQDHIVGFSICNGLESLYVPLNHINPTYNTRLPNQISEGDIRNLFKELKETKQYKYIYHNYKFDAAVFRTFLGFHMPSPYWDTLIAGYIINQDEDHSLKALYNHYIAVEDEGVNRFDTLFKGVTFDYIPFKYLGAYSSNVIRKQGEPVYYWVYSIKYYANGSELVIVYE